MIRSDEERPFSICVYELSLAKLISLGYLSPPRVVDAPIAQYDFSSLDQSEFAFGSSDELPRAVNQLLVRHKRVTRSIVEQIVELSEEQRRRGVMIFAASVEHAQEIESYLPVGQAALIVGATPGLERDRIIRAFTEQKLRYLVNVAVLTTGFDAPHVDFIALLRRTESVSLFQQIVGRGLRLSEGKTDCLVIDYAGNGYNVYSPEIGERKPSADSVIVEVNCPLCDFVNQFWGRTDSEGHIVEHFGRRCQAFSESDEKRCDYRFVFKECPKCNGENDIAARRCDHCQHLLIDPDEQLKSALSLKDALVLRVSGIEYQRKDNRLTLIYHDEDGAEVKESFDFDRIAQREVFNRVFARRLAQGRRPLELESAEQACLLQGHLPRPDFVVARRQKQKGRTASFRVSDRIFNYQGRFRKAASAD